MCWLRMACVLFQCDSISAGMAGREARGQEEEERTGRRCVRAPPCVWRKVGGGPGERRGVAGMESAGMRGLGPCIVDRGLSSYAAW